MNANDDRTDETLGVSDVSSTHENGNGARTEDKPAGPLLALRPEDYPDVSHLITEDNTPVESFYIEKQYKLLTEPLESSWTGPPEGEPFIAMTNVGLFAVPKNPPLVPDFMLSLGVTHPADVFKKEHQSYFIWIFEKPPDVTLEIVSDKLGGEETYKMQQYARMRVLYYVIYDRRQVLSEQKLRLYELRGRKYHLLSENWLAEVGLGLKFWRGTYGGMEREWLRWCDKDGNLIPTGKERADEEKRRADKEEQRAAQRDERIRRLEAQLKAAGQEPLA